MAKGAWSLIILFALYIVAQTAPISLCSTNACSGSSLTVATFNLFLDEFSPLREERIPDQISFINSSNFDVICLQELWDPAIRSRIVDGLSAFPYKTESVVSQADVCPAGIPQCSVPELRQIGRCVLGSPCNNPALNTLEKISCVIRNCFADNILSNLSRQCSRCLSFAESGLSLERRLRNCAGLLEIPEDSDLFTTCQFIYNGAVDLVVLSKYPITGAQFERFSLSPIWAAGGLRASIDVNGSLVDVFCTHPIAQAPVVDFAETNQVQAEELVAQVNASNQQAELVLVVGDFNSGPSVDRRNTNPRLDDDIDSAFPRAFEVLVGAGWNETLIATGNITCTRCSEINTLGGGDNVFIDHIFVANNAPSVCLQRSNVFATEAIVSAPSQSNLIHLSDHFGVEATFCFGER